MDQRDLTGDAVLDVRGESLRLNETLPEGHASRDLSETVRAEPQGTKVEKVLILDEAHRVAMDFIAQAATLDQTTVTLSTSSLRGYLVDKPTSGELRRLAAFLAAADAFVVLVSTTSSALADVGSALRWSRRPAAGVIESSAPLELELEHEEPAAADPPAYKAFWDLVGWLQANAEEVASATGIGRTTPASWKRDGHEPRAATVRRLYEYHSTLGALLRRLNEDGLRAWLNAGGARRRELLLAGDLSAVERDVNAVLFGDAERLPDLAWEAERPAEPKPAGSSPDEVRLMGRRPRRARSR